jgi:hypothetical protein
MTRVSCHRFRANEVRLWLSLISYNLGRQPLAAAGATGKDQQLVVYQFAAAVGENWGTLIKHARYCWLLLAESHLTRRLFTAVLKKITALPVPAG